MHSPTGKIGFFDSGLGGLTILQATAKALPQYDYVFFGDTEHLPLGDKTEEEIYGYTKAGVEELFRRGCELVIIACNTASSETLRRLQDTFLREEYPTRRILGVVIPTVEELVASGSKRALLIATKRTVESRKYDLELAKCGADVQLYSVATPGLVPLIETGEVEQAARLAAETIRSYHVDTVILGCTHYAKLKDLLRKEFGTVFLSQDEIIPAKITDYLDRHPEIESRLAKVEGGGGKRDIVLTAHRPDYDLIVGELLGGVVV